MKKVGWSSIVVVAVMLTVAVVANAQQPTKIPRIGYISGAGSPDDPGPYVEALRQGLRDRGDIEGKNFVIEYRGAQGKAELIPGLVADLIQLKVDVLVLPTISSIRPAKQATKTIPIVMVTQVDPVAAGLIDSLAHPGGNITGLATLNRELNGKRLELLKEVVPRLSRVVVLQDADAETAPFDFKEYQAAGRVLKVQLQSLEVQGQAPDLEGAFQAAVKERSNALITITSAKLFLQQKRIAELAVKSRLPSMYQGGAWVDSGGLMSYSTNDLDMYRRAATYVDKILKGVKPAELPVEQPMKFEFVVNLKTAKQIGLTIPQKVLIRADRVVR